jgi:hypothetical protein
MPNRPDATDRPAAGSSRPRAGDRDPTGGPEASIDPKTGEERPGFEKPVDGTYGGLSPDPNPGAADDVDQDPVHAGTRPERDGTHAYTREVQRSDDPGAPPMGSTVQSGSGRPDRS